MGKCVGRVSYMSQIYIYIFSILYKPKMYTIMDE